MRNMIALVLVAALALAGCASKLDAEGAAALDLSVEQIVEENEALAGRVIVLEDPLPQAEKTLDPSEVESMKVRNAATRRLARKQAIRTGSELPEIE